MGSGGGCRKGAGRFLTQVAQQIVRALAAASATGADAELGGKLLERAVAIRGAVANRFFGNGVAEADVQGRSLK